MDNRPTKNLAIAGVTVSILLLLLSSSLFSQGKNPVILIPGLSGTELRNKATGERVWFKAFRPKSGDLRLELNADPTKNRDDLEPTDVLRNVKLAGFSLTDVYGGFIQKFAERGGYQEESWETPSEMGDRDSLYVFPYDWRLDNVTHARRLINQIDSLRIKLKQPDLKFDVVAHSMGGLIARYAAMYGDRDLPSGSTKPVPTWAGAKYFDQIVLLGTPNEGSALSLSTMVDGFSLRGIRLDFPFFQDSSKFTVFTIPSAYQLLPAPGTFRVFDEKLDPLKIDLYDPKEWDKYGWNPMTDRSFHSYFNEDERKIARVYFESALARAKKLHEALAASPARSQNVSFHLIGSDCKTGLDGVMLYRDEKADRWITAFAPKAFTRPDGTRITVNEQKQVMMAAGDGVVTRRSLKAETSADNKKIGFLEDGGDTALFCEDHYKLAANSRIQDRIIRILDTKRPGSGIRARNE